MDILATLYQMRSTTQARTIAAPMGVRSESGVRQEGRRSPSGCARISDYFKCLPTSLVMSNMFTDDLPPKTVFSVASALIMRRFFLSCSPFFLM